jgi:hypothetical protein
LTVDSFGDRELKGGNEGQIHGGGIVEEGVFNPLGAGNLLGGVPEGMHLGADHIEWGPYDGTVHLCGAYCGRLGMEC